MIEILFFRIGNRVAGVETQFLEEVIHSPSLSPYLPVSPYIKEMFVNKGRPIGIIDLWSFMSLNGKTKNKELLIIECHGYFLWYKSLQNNSGKTSFRVQDCSTGRGHIFPWGIIEFLM